MYTGYFKLDENPFTTSPDPRFFYLAPSHAESMAKCEYAIRNKSGLAVVYGDVGTGKTTILNKLRERFSDDGFTIAVLSNPNQNSDTALLKAIAAEFGLDPVRTKRGAFGQLEQHLAQEVAQGRTPLLLLDEAQDLGKSIRADRDMLSMIKALTNLTAANERLIQVILFGQLELVAMLKKRRELMSRVAQFGILSPLSCDDAVAMMRHRWQTSGGALPLPFRNDALQLLYTATRGLPRDIIKVCNSALTYTYARRQKAVRVASVRYALQEHHLAVGEGKEADNE